MAKGKTSQRSSRKKGPWEPVLKYADPPWDIATKHDEMIDVLLTGRFPLIELQDHLGIRPTASEKRDAGKYGHVMGITYLISMARRNGWPVRVIDIDHVTWVFLPQEIMDEYLTE